MAGDLLFGLKLVKLRSRYFRVKRTDLPHTQVQCFTDIAKQRRLQSLNTCNHTPSEPPSLFIRLQFNAGRETVFVSLSSGDMGGVRGTSAISSWLPRCFCFSSCIRTFCIKGKAEICLLINLFIQLLSSQ